MDKVQGAVSYVSEATDQAADVKRVKKFSASLDKTRSSSWNTLAKSWLTVSLI